MVESGKIFNTKTSLFLFTRELHFILTEFFNLYELLSTEMAGQGIHNWPLSQLVTLSVK